jgi:hypothetical protein
VQAFQQLPRDRLTALAVFFRAEELPAGAVLAEQGAPADRVFLIQEGEVALVLEGDDSANPMDPYGRKAATEAVPGGEFLAAGSTAAMRRSADQVLVGVELGSAPVQPRCGMCCSTAARTGAETVVSLCGCSATRLALG